MPKANAHDLGNEALAIMEDYDSFKKKLDAEMSKVENAGSGVITAEKAVRAAFDQLEKAYDAREAALARAEKFVTDQNNHAHKFSDKIAEIQKAIKSETENAAKKSLEKILKDLKNDYVGVRQDGDLAGSTTRSLRQLVDQCKTRIKTLRSALTS